jgi:host factor-I protein
LDHQDVITDNTDSLQDIVLNQMIAQQIQVAIYLINGIKLEGLLKSADKHTIQLERGTEHQTVFKHSISTISPLVAAMPTSSPKSIA